MYRVAYIQPKTNMLSSFRVDVVLSMASEKRKFFGIHVRTTERQCYLFSRRDLRTDHHVSRHETGRVYRKLSGQAPFYPVRDGQLTTPIPMPFEISIRQPQKPPISDVRGVDPWPLFEITEGFLSPEVLFERSVARRSRADYRFAVELDGFAGQLLSFRVFDMEPNQKHHLHTYLDHLRERHHEGITEPVVYRVDVFTLFNPWLGVALLTGRGEFSS